MKNEDKPKRRIAVELFSIHNRNVGLGEFTYQLGAHLAARAAALRAEHGIEFHFIVPRGFKGCFGREVRYLEMPRALRQLARYYPLRMDICHLAHQFSRVKYMVFARENLLTIHDINFLYEKTGSKLLRYTERFRHRLSRVNHLSYISQFVREDVENHFTPAQSARVIHNGVTDLTRQSAPAADLARFGLPERYLLHISSLLPKKNVHLAVEMMAHLREENLVIVGNWNSDYARGLKARIRELGLDNVYTYDHVTDSEKAALYKHCRGFVFPSQCEGFGLPPVEAMYFGKPVFLSVFTSLPEVGGPAAYYYEPLSPERMADATRRGLADFHADADASAARVRGWAEQFDWKRCAEEYISYYLDILRGKA